MHKYNQDEIYKIEVLQRKLKHLKHMIAEATKQDSGFHNLFVQ